MRRNACQKCVFAVYDDKPHCGLRGFTTSFNVEWCEAENDKAPNGYELQEDGYFSWVKKKKEYPKTYEECCKVLDTDDDSIIDISVPLHYNHLLISFTQLLICRDAYWKIAGEEMGLGKPWTPQDTNTFSIFYDRLTCEIEKQDGYCGANSTLEFPTEEMRDAFYVNFKSDIEICKELL